MSDAVIRDRGYTAYSGPRQPERAWQVLAAHTARSLLGARGVRRATIAAFIPALIAGVVSYIESRMGRGVGLYSIELLSRAYGVVFPGLVVALAAAGSTLSEDRRAGALSFYFARPLPPLAYLAGRLVGSFAAIALVVVAPTTGLALFRVALASDGRVAISALGAALGIAALGIALAAVLTIYSLLAAALASSRGAAQGLVVLGFVLPWISAGVGAQVAYGPWMSLLSVPHLIDTLGGALREQGGIVDLLVRGLSAADKGPPVWAALIALVVLVAGGLFALRARVDRLGRSGGEAGGER